MKKVYIILLLTICGTLIFPPYLSFAQSEDVSMGDTATAGVTKANPQDSEKSKDNTKDEIATQDKASATVTKAGENLGEEIEFPLTAITQNEEIRVDLSWEPLEIEPETKTNFSFTIRDGTTGDSLSQSYDFVIIQGDNVIHKTSGNAGIDGSFEEFTFSESQAGPTIIRFENIGGTGMDTEFSLVVVPEFGSIVAMILVLTIASVIILGKNRSLSKLQFS